MHEQQMKSLVKGAVILSIASFIVKILSAVYRVPFQNLVGNTGFYVYQQVYPLYGLGMTFSLNGLPLFISKLIAEQDDFNSKRGLVQRLFTLLSFFSILIFVFLLIGSTAIAKGMSDASLAPLIQMVALMFLTMPLLSISRGYFQGTFQMAPSAISQVIEQFIRVGVILIAASLMNPLGWDVYQMGTWAMSGAFVGGVVTSGYLIWKLRQNFNTSRLATPILTAKSPITSYRLLGKRLLFEGGLLCLFSAMLILLQLVDSFTVKSALVESGFSQNAAKSLKGVYDRGQPLVQLGLVSATAFSSTLLPALSHDYVTHQLKDFKKHAHNLIRITTAIAGVSTIGLIILMPTLNYFLFGDVQGNFALALYMVAIFLAALITAFNSIMQSQNIYNTTFLPLLLGLLCKIIITKPLTRSLGINGSALSTTLSLLVIMLVVYHLVPTRFTDALFKHHFLLKLCAVSGMMALPVFTTELVLLSIFSLESRFIAAGIAIFCAGLGVVLFILLAKAFRLLTVEEWLSIPYGRKILKVNPRREQDK